MADSLFGRQASSGLPFYSYLPSTPTASPRRSGLPPKLLCLSDMLRSRRAASDNLPVKA
jgi:hypothetical protein